VAAAPNGPNWTPPPLIPIKKSGLIALILFFRNRKNRPITCVSSHTVCVFAYIFGLHIYFLILGLFVTKFHKLTK
jgi:hypothetical protein